MKQNNKKKNEFNNKMERGNSKRRYRRVAIKRETEVIISESDSWGFSYENEYQDSLK